MKLFGLWTKYHHVNLYINLKLSWWVFCTLLLKAYIVNSNESFLTVLPFRGTVYYSSQGDSDCKICG